MADVTIADLTESTTPDSDDIVEVEVDGASKKVSILNLVDVGAGAVLEADYDANSILAANSDNTPTVRTIAEQQVVGRLTGGNIKGLSTTELTGLVDAASDTAAGKIEIATLAEHTTGTSESLAATPKGVKQETDLCVKLATYDANSILYATTDNTPVALTIAASRFVGRKASGDISAMTVAEVKTLLNYDATYSLSDGATIAIDWNNGNTQYVTLAGTGRTVTFANPVSGQVYRIVITQDGTGSRTITTWPTIKWAGGSAPTLTTTAGQADIVTILYLGTTYYADCNKNF